MLIVDNKNPIYNSDFNKFLATMTGGAGPIGPTGIPTAATGGPVAAAYYWRWINNYDDDDSY